MWFPPSSSVGVADYVLAVVEFWSCLIGTGSDRRRGSVPYHNQGGRGEGWIVVLKGERSINLTVSFGVSGWH